MHVTWLVDACQTSVLRQQEIGAYCVAWLFHTRGISYWSIWHDSFIRVTRLLHTRDITWHDSFIRVTWLLYTRDLTWLIHLTRLIHTCDMTPPYLRHDWFKCNMTHRCSYRVVGGCIARKSLSAFRITFSHVWLDSFMHATWLIHRYMCDMSHSHVWHASFIRVTRPTHRCHLYIWQAWHCCSVLQGVAVRCSALQCVAVCCSKNLT